MEDERFFRWEALIGKEKLDILAQSHVMVIGIGGVGSYLTEALARGGIGALTLVDGDRIAIHNINRQVHALSSTVGQEKVVAMADRIKEINPWCQVKTKALRLTPENIADFHLEAYDYVADAIDDVPGKIAVIRLCKEKGVPLISAMGAGNKLDPARLQIADIGVTTVCPLCRSVRKKLRDYEIKEGVTVVYSKEQPQDASFLEEGRRNPASSPFVPPVAGFLMAGEIMRNLTKTR